MRLFLYSLYPGDHAKEYLSIQTKSSILIMEGIKWSYHDEYKKNYRKMAGTEL